MGLLNAARGYCFERPTAGTDEVDAGTFTMGTQLAGGFSVLISGSGRGDVKLYYTDFKENRINDPFMTGTKDSDLLILNYGGVVPEITVSLTPSGAGAMEWNIEACGVN